MDSLRLVPRESLSPDVPCCRCRTGGQPWDRIAGQAYCPDCEETLVRGEGEPFVVRTEKLPCTVCEQVGTIAYLTLPLNSTVAVALDLCPRHFRRLLGRCLEPSAHAQLRRRLQNLAVPVERVFLLHDTFYDAQGRALLPVPGVE
jgi:hypothetical protein